MDQRFFAKTPYQIPFYNYGTGFGCLQRAVADTKQILPSKSDRSAFTIDSILAHNCSRDTDPSESTSRMAITNAERYFPGRADQLRFHPYFNLPQTTLGQTNTFVKASTKNENEGKGAEQKSWCLDKPKRMRTIFTVEQLERMEREFDRQQYMVGADRFFLANELGLTETQVKVWFQNRRIKWRKNILEKQHRQLSGKVKANENA